MVIVSAKANPAAAMQTERLIPAEQQTKSVTRATKIAAMDWIVNRTSQGGFSASSDKGNRQRIKSRGRTECGSLSASSTTAASPASKTARASRRSPA